MTAFRPPRIWVAVLCLALGIAAEGARAQDASALVQTHVYAGTLAQGEAEMNAMASRNPADQTARFGLGAVQFLRALETLAQSLYGHGLQAPRAALLPILRMPVRPNPRPAPLTYVGFRDILSRFASDLAKAEATLAQVKGESARLAVDLVRVRLDLDGDGRVTDEESLWTILSGVDPRIARANPKLPESVVDSFPVTLDAGDAAWLRGYAHLLMGIAEFWLAHDFQPMFDQTFHLFFPRAGLPYAGLAAQGRSGLAGDDGSIGDAIAFVHLLSWPVREPERLARAVEHLKAVPALSRESWSAILAESDDENEWIPNPRQTNRFPGLPVTQERVDAWLKVMAELEAVLDGRKLVPHWRFDKGFNLRRALTEHQTFDAVLWATGTGLAPFLEDGPTVSPESWRQMLRAFEGNFFGYAVWFN